MQDYVPLVEDANVWGGRVVREGPYSYGGGSIIDDISKWHHLGCVTVLA